MLTNLKIPTSGRVGFKYTQELGESLRTIVIEVKHGEAPEEHPTAACTNSATLEDSWTAKNYLVSSTLIKLTCFH